MDYLIDTNYLLRFLLNDIADQSQKSREIFQKAEKEEITVTLSDFVIIEAVFILTRVYKLTRKETQEKILPVIQLPFLIIGQRERVINALDIYSETSLSFIDIMIFLQARDENKKLLTFDKKLQKLSHST